MEVTLGPKSVRLWKEVKKCKAYLDLVVREYEKCCVPSRLGKIAGKLAVAANAVHIAAKAAEDALIEEGISDREYKVKERENA